MNQRRLLCVSFCCLTLTAAGLELDESPAAAGEWGYRPEGAAVAVNPPGFSWRPVKGALGYVLQVAADADFKRLAYSREGLRFSAHCPPMPFDAGTYYWRYAATDAEGARTAWSRVRPFVVDADAVAFPLPEHEELVRRMPDDHPRLFFRPQDVPRLRELAQDVLADRYKDLVAHADKILASPPDTTEPPKYPKEVSRAKTPAAWRKIWWGNRRRVVAVADAAANLGFVYRLSGDEKYAYGARDLLVAMTAWDVDGSTNYRYNDEAAMPALYMTSRAYSWAYPALSAEDRAAVVKMMRARGTQAYDSLRRRHHLWRPYSSHHNRSWHFLGELAIAFYGDIPEAAQWLDYAMTVFYTAYPVWSDSDGGWHEGAAYWNSYMGRFMYWAYVARSAFDIDAFQRPFFSRVGYYGMYVMPPGARTGGFADQAILVKSSSIARLMAVFANGARNPHWKWYADQCGGGTGSGYLGFLYAAHAVGLEAKTPTDLPTSVCFRGVGIAVLNSSLVDAAHNVQVHFKSSPMGQQSHGYNANNAFLLTLGGHRAFIRSGKRDLYGSPHHRHWMFETKSDNAILVNGKGQRPHTSTSCGRIVAFETSPTVDVVAGEAGDAYDNLDRWTRRIVFFKPHAVLIHDVLDAPEPSTFEWLLHAIEHPFSIEGQTLTWAGTAGKAVVRLLEPAGLAISQTDQFETPPGDFNKIPWAEWHLTAQAPEKATHREFLTLITVNDANVGVDHEAGDPMTVELTLPDGEAQIEFGRDGFHVRAPGFE